VAKSDISFSPRFFSIINKQLECLIVESINYLIVETNCV